ncbi:MAG: hypothetical protein HY332_13570 [Chloroflexi bacterium]|nr:hypothetical protein [Chloroflexota bacterium]
MYRAMTSIAGAPVRSTGNATAGAAGTAVNGTRLLLDRRLIECTEGVRLTIAQGRQHPANPLTIDGERVWTRGNLHFICNYHSDDGTYWGWYCQRVVDGIAGSLDDWYAHLVPVRSEDGLRWRSASEPVFPGKERTILFDPGEADPGRRFKSVYQRLLQRDAQGNLVTVQRAEMRRREAAGERGTRQMVSSWSADGHTWAEPNVVVTSTEHPDHRWWRVGDPGWDGSDSFPSLIWCPERQVYVALFRTNIYNGLGQRRERGVGRSESADFGHWSPPELALHANVPRHTALGYPTHDFYQLQVWRCAGVYLGVLSVFYWGEDRNHLELAWSPDTVSWERVCAGTDLVPHGKLGEYDGGCRYAAMRPIAVGDAVRLYYGGSTGRHNADRVGESAACLALFKRDRFAGYTAATAGGGVILTRPFALAAAQLTLNVDAAGGDVRAELCDLEGMPLPGFGRAEAVPIAADALDAALAWRGGESAGTDDAYDLARLNGQQVRLRLYLRRATVYALHLGPESSE